MERMVDDSLRAEVIDRVEKRTRRGEGGRNNKEVEQGVMGASERRGRMYEWAVH